MGYQRHLPAIPRLPLQSNRVREIERMNLLPIELYLSLILIIPIGVCFAKWSLDINWLTASLTCAFLSWLYFNLWFFELDPPENGFTTYFYFLSGWFWLLPFLGAFIILFHFVEKLLSKQTRQKTGVIGSVICLVITATIVIWNFVGRMSPQRAITEARSELIQRGYVPYGREIPDYQDGHWIIKYPDTEFGEIRLHRNGRLSWIGGPG